jgi:hypothetical protein
VPLAEAELCFLTHTLTVGLFFHTESENGLDSYEGFVEFHPGLSNRFSERIILKILEVASPCLYTPPTSRDRCSQIPSQVVNMGGA